MKEIVRAVLKKDIQQLEQMIAMGPPGVPGILVLVKEQLAEKRAKLAELEAE